ncbi:HNH endonuclease signature motif containing protein [Escherichia phage ES]|nr:HNH endonuclease signature motif containing protein [Escherichia phage ES]
MDWGDFFYLSDDSVSGIKWKVNKGRSMAGDDALTSVGNGYYKGRLNQKTTYAHRVVYFLNYGVIPDVIDHMDGNGLNNSIENLRDGTTAKNMQNKLCKGYSYNKRDDVYYAQVTTNGVTKHVGSFASKELAIAAYLKEKELQHDFYNKERKICLFGKV